MGHGFHDVSSPQRPGTVGWSNSGSPKPHRAAPMRCRPQPVASVAHAPRGSTRFKSYDPPKRSRVFYCFEIWPSINTIKQIPSGNVLHSYWTWTFIVSCSHWNSWFSMAMLVYWKVKRRRVFFVLGIWSNDSWRGHDEQIETIPGTKPHIYIYIYNHVIIM